MSPPAPGSRRFLPWHPARSYLRSDAPHPEALSMRRPVAVLSLSVAVLAITCKSDGGTATPVPTTVTITPGAVTLSALGASQPLTATVRDQNNNVMTGQGITWSSTNTAAVSVSTGGVVTAVAN